MKTEPIFTPTTIAHELEERLKDFVVEDDKGEVYFNRMCWNDGSFLETLKIYSIIACHKELLQELRRKEVPKGLKKYKKGTENDDQ